MMSCSQECKRTWVNTFQGDKNDKKMLNSLTMIHSGNWKTSLEKIQVFFGRFLMWYLFNFPVDFEMDQDNITQWFQVHSRGKFMRNKITLKSCWSSTRLRRGRVKLALSWTGNWLPLASQSQTELFLVLSWTTFLTASSLFLVLSFHPEMKRSANGRKYYGCRAKKDEWETWQVFDEAKSNAFESLETERVWIVTHALYYIHLE